MLARGARHERSDAALASLALVGSGAGYGWRVDPVEVVVEHSPGAEGGCQRAHRGADAGEPGSAGARPQQTDQVRARLNQTEDALKSLRDKTGIVSLKDGQMRSHRRGGENQGRA